MEMQAQDIQKLAEDVLSLIRDYRILFSEVQLFILVSQPYYDAIKVNFPDRLLALPEHLREEKNDLIIVERGNQWIIQLQRATYPSPDNQFSFEYEGEITRPDADATLNKAQLSGIARKVLELIKRDQFDLHNFTMQITIPRDYYELVKNNFPERHPIDRIFGVSRERWAVDVMYLSIPLNLKN
jgi:hypothetical protein